MGRPDAKSRLAGALLSTTVALAALVAVAPSDARAADYVDNFTTNPIGDDPVTSFTTGTVAQGLSYTFTADGDGGDFSWLSNQGHNDSASLDALSAAENHGTTERFTIASRDERAFVFDSIYLDILGDGITVSGSGPEPFSFTAGSGTNGTHTPDGGSKLVTEVVLTSTDFWDELIDNVDVELDVPGMDVQGDGTTIVNGDATPSADDDTDFGSATQGVAVSRAFTIRSLGDANLDLEGSPYVTFSSNPSGDFSVSAQPTTDPIAPGGADTFTIECTPSGTGARTATVSIDNDSEADPYRFDVSCTGTAPQPEIDIEGNGVSIPDGDTTPQAADHTHFGDVAVGTSFDRTFTIENEGTATLNLTGTPDVAISGSGDFNVETQPATSSIAAGGADLTFVVRCTPTGTGDRTATVSIASNDGDEDPYTFDVRATGTAPEIDVEGNGMSIPDGDTTPQAADHTDFGDVAVETSLDRTFTIENEGSAVLTLTGHPNAVALSGSGDFSVHTQPGSGSIAPSGTATFVVRCTPSGTGDRTATVSIASDDGDEDPYTFDVRATGIAPEIDVKGNGVSIPDGDTSPRTADDTDFGSVDIVGGTNPNTFTISNSGAADLKLDGATRVAVTGDAADFTVTTQPATPVASGGGTTTFTITFDPTVGGARSATVSIANNDLDEDPYTFDIQGTGDAPEIDVTGRGVSIPDGDATPQTADDTDFGDVLVAGGSDTHTFTIRNTGPGTLTLDGTPRVQITGDTADFTVTAQPTSATVPSGGTTTFDVQFDPTATEERSVTVSIANSDANEHPYDFVVQGTGTAPEIEIEGKGQSIPDGDVTPGAADDTEFGDLDILAAPVVHTFTIGNEGTADLNLSAGLPRATSSDPVFAISVQPATPITPAGTTTFDVSFDPTVAGEVTSTIRVANDDADEDPYTFRVHGTGTVTPEIDVQGLGQSIPNGDDTPSVDDDTQFGSVAVAGGAATHTFTLRNDGSENLILTDAPDAVGVDQTAFRVTTQPGSPIAPGGEATFALHFDPEVVGVVTATVSIASNDADEDPYTFQVQGQGTESESGGGGPAPIGAPTATTGPATNVTMNGATVGGTVYPNVMTTDVTFEWGAAANGSLALAAVVYTDTIVAEPSPVSGLSPVSVTARLVGLRPGTTYHYRVVACNDRGTTCGEGCTLTTEPIAVGDIDGDGIVGLVDVRLCAAIAKGERDATAAEREQADVDGDGDVDMDDAIALSEFILGWREVLP